MVSSRHLMLAAFLALLAATASANETIIYGYDSLGRLVRVERSGTANNAATAHYLYDSADNRTSVTVSLAGSPPPPTGNQPPTAVADSASVPRCGRVTRNLIANDTDPEGRGLSLVQVIYNGQRGTASRVSATSAGFVSNGLEGMAAISYTVRDALGAESTGAFTVTVTSAGECG